jgi:hypothetical protein
MYNDHARSWDKENTVSLINQWVHNFYNPKDWTAHETASTCTVRRKLTTPTTQAAALNKHQVYCSYCKQLRTNTMDTTVRHAIKIMSHRCWGNEIDHPDQFYTFPDVPKVHVSVWTFMDLVLFNSNVWHGWPALQWHSKYTVVQVTLTN